MNAQYFEKFLCEKSAKGDLSFKTKADLSEISTFRIGGKANFLISPTNQDSLINVIKKAIETDIEFKVIGNASNVLFSDHGFEGAIISTKLINKITETDESIICECGVMLPYFCAYAAKKSYDGFAGLCGIPATIGGAFYLNSGAFGHELADKLLSYKVYKPSTNTVSTKSVTEQKFSYRQSPITNTEDVLLCCTFMKSHRPYSEISEDMRKFSEKRKLTQPSGHSAGSYFKRVRGVLSAAALIDKAGLKGMSCGGAQVSLKHAGFIVNTENATSEDVLRLAERIKSIVFEKFGEVLSEEVIFIGTPHIS